MTVQEIQDLPAPRILGNHPAPANREPRDELVADSSGQELLHNTTLQIPEATNSTTLQLPEPTNSRLHAKPLITWLTITFFTLKRHGGNPRGRGRRPTVE